MTKIKPQRLWGVTYTNSQTEVNPESIRRTRREAQHSMHNILWRPTPTATPDETWRYWHKAGCRAVRITLTVESPNDA